jgi:hypothetical protein
MPTHPCSSIAKTSGACRGYVVDHITPLKRSGADASYDRQRQDPRRREGEGQVGVRE